MTEVCFRYAGREIRMTPEQAARELQAFYEMCEHLMNSTNAHWRIAGQEMARKVMGASREGG